MEANGIKPNQIALMGTVWSGSILFAAAKAGAICHERLLMVNIDIGPVKPKINA